MWQPGAVGRREGQHDEGSGDGVYQGPRQNVFVATLSAAAGLAKSERLGRTNFFPRLHGVSSMSLLLVSAIRISLCFLSLGTLEM